MTRAGAQARPRRSRRAWGRRSWNKNVPGATSLFRRRWAAGDFLGVGEDPAGDASDPDPARDITAAGISYERRTGELHGALRLRGTPSTESSSFITLFAGIRTGSGCNGYPAIGFGSYSDEVGASWLKLGSRGTAPSASGEAVKTGYLDPVQEFEVDVGALVGSKPDCVVATLTEPGNGNNVYDSVGPIPLRALPALQVRLGNVPSSMRPGEEKRLKLVVSNPGDAGTGRIKLSVKQARGLSVRLPGRVPSIAPGKQRSLTLKVTLSKRARSLTPLRVTARAGKLYARAEEDLDLLRTSPGNDGGDDTFTPQLCNRWVPDLSGETGGSLVLIPC